MASASFPLTIRFAVFRFDPEVSSGFSNFGIRTTPIPRQLGIIIPWHMRSGSLIARMVRMCLRADGRMAEDETRSACSVIWTHKIDGLTESDFVFAAKADELEEQEDHDMTASQAVTHWDSIDDLLDFTIDKEQEAVEFYTDLAEKADNPAMRTVFAEFADVEKGHKARLQRVKKEGDLNPSASKVLDLKIADYLVDVEPEPGMNYQQALIIAMKREQASHDLYTDLAAATDEKDVRDLMLALAQEEARHKLRFETEYDEYVLKDN